jgi:hypothetical protein
MDRGTFRHKPVQRPADYVERPYLNAQEAVAREQSVRRDRQPSRQGWPVSAAVYPTTTRPVILGCSEQ